MTNPSASATKRFLCGSSLTLIPDRVVVLKASPHVSKKNGSNHGCCDAEAIDRSNLHQADVCPKLCGQSPYLVNVPFGDAYAQ